MKKIYLTERAFAKLFYEILLRLEPKLFTFKIYKALENCILFINSHLNLIKTDSFGNINLIEEKRIIGFEAILNVYIYTEDERVKMNTRRIFQSIISKQIEKVELIENIVIEEFLSPLLSMIEDLKEKIPSEPQESINAIKVILKLIEETQVYMVERLRRYDMMSSINVTGGSGGQNQDGVNVIKLHEMSNTNDNAAQSGSVLYGFNDEITLKVNNSVKLIYLKIIFRLLRNLQLHLKLLFINLTRFLTSNTVFLKL